MPLSRVENTTFDMHCIIDFHDMGLRTVYSPDARKKTPIQRLMVSQPCICLCTTDVRPAHRTLPDEHTSHDQKKGGNVPPPELTNKKGIKNKKRKNKGKESSEEFIFPKKTARPVSPTSSQDPVVTSNNFSDLEQDVEHPLPTTNQVTAEVVTPKIKLPHPIMLKIIPNFREPIK
ncbi:hypothetical protein TNCV_4792971 [Trichonephila clavipes]|nr:hypothetical protein TNCV_4792971 [Trichonephila clavipes]